VQNDSAGNLWLVEDVGGASPAGSKARNPNSFVYRLVPYDRADLTRGGRLQALQVVSRRTGTPITFQPIDAAHPTGGIFTPDQQDLSSYGRTFDTRWVTIHDTRVDTSGQPFDANAAAKSAAASGSSSSTPPATPTSPATPTPATAASAGSTGSARPAPPPTWDGCGCATPATPPTPGWTT
jgi:hypothetical protein